jgi:hypothetical protein
MRGKLFFQRKWRREMNRSPYVRRFPRRPWQTEHYKMSRHSPHNDSNTNTSGMPKLNTWWHATSYYHTIDIRDTNFHPHLRIFCPRLSRSLQTRTKRLHTQTKWNHSLYSTRNIYDQRLTLIIAILHNIHLRIHYPPFLPSNVVNFTLTTTLTGLSSCVVRHYTHELAS